MSENTKSILFALLRAALHDSLLSDTEKALFSKEQLPQLYAVSERQDIAHLVGWAIKKNLLIDTDNEYFKKFQKIQIIAMYRYEKLNRQLEKICSVLEDAKIPFMPLKGAVIRKLYKEPWMRTSCDVDVLVHEEDLQKAASILTAQCGYIQKQKGAHDILMLTPDDQHIELHYSLVEEGRANGAWEVLKTVWDDAVLKDGFNYQYEMSDEMFYFYHVAHMAKHFETGGCGIRTFIDLWLLNNKAEYDKERRDFLLQKGNLLTFADACRRLAQVWFEEAEADDLSKQMENYLLRGGVYGSRKNHVNVGQIGRGGKFKYALSRIFLPYDVIKFQYPILEKYRCLTPFYEVRRWFRLVFGGNIKKSMREFDISQGITKKQTENTKKFLNDIGLS